MAKIQKTVNTKLWQGRGATETAIHCWWECQLGQSLWETMARFLTELTILVPCDPARVLLGIYLNELKMHAHTETHTWIFTAALFITTKTWKQNVLRQVNGYTLVHPDQILLSTNTK